MQILLSNSTTVKQEQEEISHNHVPAFFPGSVEEGKGRMESSVVCTNIVKSRHASRVYAEGRRNRLRDREARAAAASAREATHGPASVAAPPRTFW